LKKHFLFQKWVYICTSNKAKKTYGRCNRYKWQTNKMKNLSQANKNFFNYSFKGNGKYYTVEQGSRHYNNTTFQNFYNKNSECIDILEFGNDAPRGGQTGNFVVVNFNEKFFEKWQFALDILEAKKQEKDNKEANKEASRKSIIAFLEANKELVSEKKAELYELKEAGEKEQWQVKANALVQMVSKNDFSLGWKEIYTLIKIN